MTPLRTFAEDVAHDLSLPEKQLQSKYLYDPLGIRLFGAICRLPWYGITRGEISLLRKHAEEIASELPGPLTVTELGPGDGEKIALLVPALARYRASLVTHLIDISQTALDESERQIDRYEGVSVVGHRTTYEAGLKRVAAERSNGDRLLVLFLGSNLGNFDPDAAREFLRSIREALQPEDALLIGADLVKPERDLLAAYDDPLGVTAAFNRNLLVRINRELAGEFAISDFSHCAIWNGAASRVEMRLVSARDHSVAIPGAGITPEFRRGETIWTESSYKFEREALEALVEDASFRRLREWIDQESRFALGLFLAT